MLWDRIQSFLAQSGIFMIPLALCSFAALAIIVQRALALRRGLTMPEPLLDALNEPAEDLDFLARQAQRDRSPLGRIIRAALLPHHRSREEAAEAAQATAREELVRLQTGLSALEVIITIAPLLGLLGTVSGLVTVFSGIGSTDGQAPASATGIARGIAEALNTTIAGLAIAVPTVVAHSFFHKKIERMAVRMEVLLQSLIHRAFR